MVARGIVERSQVAAVGVINHYDDLSNVVTRQRADSGKLGERSEKTVDCGAA
jgi:hypothetical protein